MTDELDGHDDVVDGHDDLGATENPEVDDQSLVLPLDSAFESRRKRIFDHRVEAQEDPSTTIACLAGVNSDLLDNELVIAEMLRQCFSAEGVSLETMEKTREPMNLLLRLSKQIAQITQLENRSRKGNGEGSSPKPR